MTKKAQNTFWFIFVMGILLFGIGMVIWTVKQSVSAPVHESNNYMLTYQTTDLNINQIAKSEKAFNANYRIELTNMETINLAFQEQNVHAKRSQKKPVALKMGDNTFSYRILKKDGTVVTNAKVHFLLTRPHTRVDDVMQQNLDFIDDAYMTEVFKLSKEGRYTLQVKVIIDQLVGHLETAAYLQK